MLNIFRSIGLMLGWVSTPALEGDDMRAWDFGFEAIGGGALPLEQFKGRVVLIVNTASQCGFTPQYSGLQALHHAFNSEGFSVLGVPSNDFGAQEPGSSETIQNFCVSRFSVTFPLTEKTVVVGADAHPFYRWVVAMKGPDAAPRWNFHKILISRAGAIAGVFSSRVKPDSPELKSAIEAELRASV